MLSLSGHRSVDVRRTSEGGDAEAVYREKGQVNAGEMNVMFGCGRAMIRAYSDYRVLTEYDEQRSQAIVRSSKTRRIFGEGFVGGVGWLLAMARMCRSGLRGFLGMRHQPTEGKLFLAS